MWRKWGGTIVLTGLLAGCSADAFFVNQSQSVFPPQKVMEHKNFAGFLAENQRRLQQCEGSGDCDVALFNLGFLSAYPQSPYRNHPKALQYFTQLLKKYPRSPLAYQGQAWIALLHEHLNLDESRRRLQADLRTQETTIRGLREQITRSREIDLEIEKKERALSR